MGFAIFIHEGEGINSFYGYKDLKNKVSLIPATIATKFKGLDNFPLCRTKQNKIMVTAYVSKIIPNGLHKINDDSQVSSDLFRATEIYRIKSVLMLLHDAAQQEGTKNGLLKIIGLLEPVFHRGIHPYGKEEEDA